METSVDLVYAIGQFLHLSWDFFTEVNVPGMPFTFAALFVGLFLAGLSLRLLSYMFGFGSISSNTILGLRRKDDE
ncbi:hypothetical protein KL86CLO1_11111 [uncultured Eubacteriales bacterium]|uniref:Uncharacterized protein n=1 Tax=uncultured Eubacteriales bacterium TaxID=172733 RepID=A0A212JHN6_9FIRM|nr:hypothetical protein KL86CLO1_11111 [uncultured Eubacteriales bacterium]